LNEVGAALTSVRVRLAQPHESLIIKNQAPAADFHLHLVQSVVFPPYRGEGDHDMAVLRMTLLIAVFAAVGAALGTLLTSATM